MVRLLVPAHLWSHAMLPGWNTSDGPPACGLWDLPRPPPHWDHIPQARGRVVLLFPLNDGQTLIPGLLPRCAMTSLAH